MCGTLESNNERNKQYGNAYSVTTLNYSKNWSVVPPEIYTIRAVIRIKGKVVSN